MFSNLNFKPTTIAKWLNRFLLICIALVSVILLISIFTQQNWYELGSKFGTLSLLLFCVIITPGIIQRFKFTGPIKNIGLVLRLIRRRLGVLMYILGLSHYWMVKLFFAVQTGILQVSLFETFGFIALLALTPLFLTSNNFSLKIMKRWWTRLHYLIYPVTWLIVLHVALQGQKITLIIGIFAILQIASLLYAWYAKTPKANA